MSLADKLPNASASTIARNPGLFGRSIAGTGLGLPAPKKERIRQDKKPLMNKLETEWFHQLELIGIQNLRAQSIRYKLGNGIWYKPDMTGTLDWSQFAWEVKGPHSFRGGMENLKVAASLYTEITFYLVWIEDGLWQRQQVFP